MEIANINTGYGLQRTYMGDDIMLSVDLNFLKKYLLNDPDFRAMFKGPPGAIGMQGAPGMVDYENIATFVNNYIRKRLDKLRIEKEKQTFTYEELMELFL